MHVSELHGLPGHLLQMLCYYMVGGHTWVSWNTWVAVQVEELKTINRELLEQVISHCPPPLPSHSPLLEGEPLRRTRTMPL